MPNTLIEAEIRADLVSKIDRYLSNSAVRQDHALHIMKKYRGDDTISFSLSPRDYLVSVAKVCELAKARKIMRATRYLNDSYFNKAVNFQTCWYRLPELQEGELEDLKDQFSSRTPEFSPATAPKGFFFAKVYQGVHREFRLLFANYHSSENNDPDTGLPISNTHIDKKSVIFRANGVEVRAHPSDANVITKTIRRHLELIYPQGHNFNILNPQLIRYQPQLSNLLDNLSGRLRIYNGSDHLGECDKKAATAYLTTQNKSLRNLRTVARMRDLLRRRRGITQPSEVTRMIAAPFASAEIEFDYRHPDGFVEDSIKVELSTTNIKFRSKTSEPAMRYFWRALDNAVAR